MKKFKVDQLVRRNIRDLRAYASARNEFSEADRGMIFLDANENPYNSGLNRYPDPGHVVLRAKLSDLRQVPKEAILLGNGSDEVLDLVFRAFCEPGKDNVITLPPTYGMYRVLCALNGQEMREVSLNENFQPDADRIMDQVDEHSKLLLLCSPNNPTGNLMSATEIEILLSRFPGLVVIDEAYIDFAEGKSWVADLAKYPNLLITQTFSKAWGMAGIRLGMALASPEIISILNKIKPPYNVDQLTLEQAILRIEETEKVHGEIGQIVAGREFLRKELTQMESVVEVFPSDANFLLVRVDDAERHHRELIQQGIVVRNRSEELFCGNTLRITVGTPEENVALINAFKNFEI